MDSTDTTTTSMNTAILNNKGLIAKEAILNNVDRLTMELLLNKTHYAKYLSKTDSQKHAEFQQFVDSLRKFRDPIVDITQRLIRNPKSATFSQDMIESFQTYTQSVIRFLEIQEDDPANGEEEDPDEMFPASMNGYTFQQEKKKRPPVTGGGTLDGFIIKTHFDKM